MVLHEDDPTVYTAVAVTALLIYCGILHEGANMRAYMRT
jgi:hypothetical protein